MILEKGEGNMFKRFLKNEKGLTLIELLAVIVILGIIAAIAVPSIGGLIDNSRKEAHIANARQMIGAAKIYVSSRNAEISTPTDLTLQTLISEGLIDDFKDPDGGAGYNKTASKVVVSKSGNSYTYSVYLKGSKRTVQNSQGNPVSENELDKDDVVDNTN
jgi:type IV pilus assembly protein PilA